MLSLRLAAAGFSFLGASAAHAQWGGYPVGNGRYPVDNGRNGSQLVFEWHGTVDRETQINVGRSNVSVHGVSNNESRGQFVRRGTLPRGSGTLYVQRIDGRGNVDVIQQPGSGYGDGIIRIRDSQGGADSYTIRAYWQPNGSTTADNGRWDRNGTYDRNDGRYDRDGDGDYDRADRRVEQAERRADHAQRKADREREKARRKAAHERRHDRDHDDDDDDDRSDRRW